MDDRASAARTHTALQLAQLGSLVAGRFAARTRAAGFTPSEAAVLRLIARRAARPATSATPGPLSQRELADRLHTAPSRVVALIDGLEHRGLVTRTRSETDRRNHELHLTESGSDALRQLRVISEQHERDILSPLSGAQSAMFAELLDVLARGHHLDDDLHPGVAAPPA